MGTTLWTLSLFTFGSLIVIGVLSMYVMKLLDKRDELIVRNFELRDENEYLKRKNDRLENDLTLLKLNYRGGKNDNQ